MFSMSINMTVRKTRHEEVIGDWMWRLHAAVILIVDAVTIPGKWEDVWKRPGRSLVITSPAKAPLGS